MICTTLNNIRQHGPCIEGWSKLLHHLGKTSADDEPLPFATIVASNGLADALWCCQAAPQYEKQWRLFAVWCARQVQHLMTDERSIHALDIAEAHANGTVSDGQLAVANDAAWEAAGDGAWETAGEVAWDATWEASWDAAVETSWDAVEAITREAVDVSWVAARGTASTAAWEAPSAAAWTASKEVAWASASDTAREAAWASARAIASGATWNETVDARAAQTRNAQTLKFLEIVTSDSEKR